MKKLFKFKGCLVWNYLIYMKGLILILKKLIWYEGIEIIILGVIGSFRSYIFYIKLKILVFICGGFKFIVR